MMPVRPVPLIALVIIVLISAGCMQQGAVAPPVQTPVSTTLPDTTLPGTPAIPVPVTSTALVTCTTPLAPVTPPRIPEPPAAGFRLLQDADYSLQYPASWQTNETSKILPEFIHTKHGCMVTSYYQTFQRLRFFTSPGGDALIYTMVVDTNTDVWPRDLDGQIDYADVVNAILGDPTHCANTPAGAFTISSVSQASVGGVPYHATRVDFGKINSLGYADGAGTAYLVTGVHKHGVFAFYAANSSAGVWDDAGTNMFNTLSLNSYF